MGFLSPNIQSEGRRRRGIAAAFLLVAGVAALFFQPWIGGLLLCSGAFVLFEALRGWCVLRACGVKTKY
jgi:hypothetical protein